MNIYYHVRFKKHYKKWILPNETLRKRFKERIALFRQTPKNPTLHDHPLKGNMTGYRALSITGDVRVIYYITNDTLHLYDIGTHNQVYT